MIAHRYLSRKGKGANIPNGVIETALTRHPDGYGIAWRDKKKGLMYAKFGPTERNQFREFLKDIDAVKGVEYVAHFRYATHGPEDEDHAHPFAYEDPDPKVGTVLVFHNGIISGVTPKKSESDTEVFVRDWLSKLPSKWWENPGIVKLVGHMGGWSRLVLMTNSETVNLNHYAGEDDGGLWYSSDHRPFDYSKYKSGKGGGKWTMYGSYDDSEDDSEAYKAWLARRSGEHISDEQYKDTSDRYTSPRANDDVWLHAGHTLAPMQTFDFTKDGDYEAGVICDTCVTAGDVYIVDGKAYVDINHLASGESDEDEGDLLPAETGWPESIDLARTAATALLTAGPSQKPNLTLVTGASGQSYARVN